MGRGLVGRGNPPEATDRSRAPRDDSRLGRSGLPKEAERWKEAPPARAPWQLRHAQNILLMGMGKGKVFKNVDRRFLAQPWAKAAREIHKDSPRNPSMY